MYPDVDFLDWFLWGLLGQNFWTIQYVASFFTWGVVGGIASLRLAQNGIGDRFAFGALFATVWYLSIQTHWIVKEATKHAGYVEWWWSTFETFVAMLLVLSLCRRN